MKPAVLFAIGLALTLRTGAAAPVPDDAKDAAKKELARLAGTWEVTSLVEGGTTVVDPKSELGVVFAVKADGKFEIEVRERATGNQVVRTTGKVIAVDPTKTPKEISYQFFDGEEEGKVQKAVYTLDGDAFSDCCARPGAEGRPTEFRSTAKNTHSLASYERVKKTD